MNYNLYIDNKQGDIYELPAISIKWHTQIKNKASDIKVEVVKHEGLKIENGSVLHLECNGEIVFRGFIFKVEVNEGDILTISAYDQLIYLVKNKDTFIFKDKTANQILKEIGSKFGLQIGKVTDTKHKINKIYENKSLMDIMTDALELTLKTTNQLYILYDKAGSLCIAQLPDLRMNVYIGEEKAVTAFDYGKSIEDSYNIVKLTKKDEKAGKYKHFVAQDSENMGKWGTLQYNEIAKENESDGEVQNKAQQFLQYYNRESETLKITAIGGDEMHKLRAGASFELYIKDVFKNVAVIESAEHTFEHGTHFIAMEVMV